MRFSTKQKFVFHKMWVCPCFQFQKTRTWEQWVGWREPWQWWICRQQGIWLEVEDNYSLLSCTSVIAAALNHPSRGYLGWKTTSKVKQTLLITIFFPINIINTGDRDLIFWSPTVLTKRLKKPNLSIARASFAWAQFLPVTRYLSAAATQFVLYSRAQC